MRLLLFGFLGTFSMLWAQTPTVNVQPGRPTSTPEAKPQSTTAKWNPSISAPTLGFLEAPGGAGLIPIEGLASKASLGEPIPFPDGSASIYLAPRQHYAFVWNASDRNLAIWHLARRHVVNGQEALDPLPGTLGHPDLVAFSPKGTSAALYFGASARLQIVKNLPGRAVVASDISTGAVGLLSSIAVSDDGALVVGIDSVGQFQLSSAGQSWRVLPWNYAPLAWSFVSNTHNLIVSDSLENNTYLLRQIDSSTDSTTLGESLQPDHLAVTSDGGTAVALDTRQQRIWSIDLMNPAVTPIPLTCPADALIMLRDGHTLLLSNSAQSGLSLLKLSADSAPRIASVASGLQLAQGACAH